MNNCRGCGAPFRKGKRRALLSDDGTVTITLVCLSCVRRGFTIIRPIGGAANLCTICKERPARICSACAAKARAELVLPVIAQLSALARAATLNGQTEKAEGFEGAARALALEADRG